MEKEPNIFERKEERRKEELKKTVEEYYDTFPEKRKIGNLDANLAKEMTQFLIDKEYINEIKTWNNSWGCKYENKVIFLNERAVPQEKENYYIFRLGKNRLTGEYLFPKTGEGVGGEVDAYRFLHEASHAYQDWLKDQSNSDEWFERAISKTTEEKPSPLENIFKFCYKKRESQGFGLSTWGNVSDYEQWAIESAERYLQGMERNEENIKKAINYGFKCEIVARAWEDTNELSTMYLWHPEYLNTFLEYLSGSIDGYGIENLKEDMLAKITEEEKALLQENISQYIGEMKDNIEESNLRRY